MLWPMPLFARAGVPVPIDSSYHLVFDDEFNGSSIDTSKWNFSYPWGGTTTPSSDPNYGNNEVLPQNVWVANGVANLLVTRGPTHSRRQYGSAYLTAKTMFTYGYWEARIKMPTNADGVWAALWLLGNGTGSGGEIDILEWLGVRPTNAYMTYHQPGEGQEQCQYQTNYDGAFHVIGVFWTPSAINTYVDGVKVCSATSNISSSPMTTSLNNSVANTTNWDNNFVDSATVLPSVLQVDYVHIYSNNPNVQAVTPQANYGGPGDTGAPLPLGSGPGSR